MKMESVRAGGSRAGLWGIPFIVGYIIACNALATQYLAAKFAHHPALGQPIAAGIYAPWSWIIWVAKFGNNARSTFMWTEAALFVAMGVGFLAYVLFIGFRSRRMQRHEGIHGTAHWADEAEVRATGLLPEPGKRGAGVYVGGWTDKKGQLHYLRHNGPEHVAAIAPTRSGKGVSLVVTTLLSWPESAVVLDSKAELFNQTAGWRHEKAGNVIVKFDPAAAEGSAGYNPLDTVRIGTKHEVGDVQNTVTIIVDPDGKGLVDHWAKTSHAFLTGVVLHEQYKARAAKRTASLPDIAAALSDPARPIEAYYKEMLENEHLGPGQMHPTVASAARDMLNRPDEERGSVLSTAMSFLALYRDPLVAGNVSRSDFQLDGLMDGEKPVTLYIVIRAEDKDRLKPLIRLMLNQIVRVLLRPELTFKEGRPLPPHKHRLLLMLDEFPSYGKLEVFQEALAYIAGYGIKAYIIMQDLPQLWNAYGRDETITSNCHVRVAFAPNKIETAEWLSKMGGTMTVVKEDITTSGHRFGAVLQNVNRSFHELSRPLITPDEALRLKAPVKGAGDQITEAGDVLVFVAGHAPIYGTQSLFFVDPTFVERAKIAPPAPPVLAAASTAPTTPAEPAPKPATAAPGRTAPAHQQELPLQPVARNERRPADRFQA